MKKKISLLFLIISSLFLSGCGPTQNKQTATTTPPATQDDLPASISQAEQAGSDEALRAGPSPTSSASVTLPTGEDIVRTFFTLINEKRIPEAVAMLSQEAAPDETTKQTWGVNFNSLESITVKSINEWQKEGWTEKEMTYKVVMVAKVKPESSFRAWDDGENTKWINLKKEADLWKIFQIASGP